MKAAVYFGKNDVRIMEIARPEVGDEDVLVKVKYCGVCGTDLHIYHGDGGAMEVPPGTVIGHEISGVVEELGDKVKGLKRGDCVSINPNQSCGECYYCRNKMEHFCEKMIGYGTSVDGGFAEYVCAAQRQVYKLPEGLSLEEGCQCETLSCCVNGIDLCEIKAGDTVLVLGAGPIGLMMIQLAHNAGAGKVIVSELVREKRELAIELGADVAFDPREEKIEEVLKREAKNVDCVIEAVGSKVTQREAIEYAGKKSTVMLFGLVAPETEIAVKPYTIFNRELKIVASYINPYTFDRAMKLLGQKRVRMDEIITDILPLEELPCIFVEEKYRKRGKVIIKIGE